MRNEEKRVHQEIERILISENFDFDMERKLPEISTLVDFFIFSKIPTVIEIIRLSYSHFTRKSTLISKLLTLKLVNDGHIRVIPVFFVSSLQNRNLLKKLKDDLILERIADEIIILDKNLSYDKEFKLDQEDSNKIKNAIRKEIKIEEIILDIVKLKEIEVSFSRVNYTLENLYSFPGKDSLILSFYYNLFKDETRDNLKSIFLTNYNMLIENTYGQFKQRYDGRSYSHRNPEEVFDDFFNVIGWNYEDIEFQAIINEFTKSFERKLYGKKKSTYFFMHEPFHNLFLDEFNTIKDNFKTKESDFKHYLASYGYYGFRKNFLDYLLYYCLRNSKFKEFTPVESLAIENEDFRNYQKLGMNRKLVIFKTLDLDYRYESFLSLVYFGNYLRGYFSDKVILIVFLASRKKSGYLGIKNERKKLILLEENGWKTFPLGLNDDILLKLNELYEELIQSGEK